MNVEPSQPYFLGLCSADKQPQLAAACGVFAPQLKQVETVESLLQCAVQHPPLALVLELATSIRAGAERMSKFLNLGVSWPVMRCAVGSEGDARIMCFEPPHGEPLCQALAAIVQGDPAWSHPRFSRRHLRLNIPGRIRVRVAGETRWRRGNHTSISCGDCFALMTSDAPEVGERVEIELIDLAQPMPGLAGTVAWQRTWDEGLEVPGVEIEFCPETVPASLRSALSEAPELLELVAE